LSRNLARRFGTKEAFPGIGKIRYDPSSKDVLTFKHYDAKKVIMGRTMEDWCRFSVCYWHTFRGTGADPFGGQTLFRPWDDMSNSVQNAINRADAAFEFITKLGVPFYTFHTVDVAPEGDTLKESNANLDKVADHLEKKQKETGVKLLWGTANLFSHWRYAQGASTNPDAHVFAYAAAQVKKAMEVTLRLGGENYVFWGGREGFQSALNTNVRRELDHMARFLHMAVEHKQAIGAKYQLLIEPKPREPSRHQYDYDAQTVYGFLKHYGLEKHFKVNIEPNHTTLAGHSYEHDLIMSSKFGYLGSIDANTGEENVGWDTDQFPMDVKKAMITMQVVIEQGGLAPGGLNFDAKVRRESTDLEDFFIGHIGAMDTFARGLKAAAALKQDGVYDKWLTERYSSYDNGFGKLIEDRKASMKDCEEYIHKNGEAKRTSGKQEKYEVLYNTYV